MGRFSKLSLTILAASTALTAACPCCPTCTACTCNVVPAILPASTVTVTTALPMPTPTVATTKPGPLLKCTLNCYGDAATAVPLPGGDGSGVPVDTIESCRDFCFATEGCEGVIYGSGKCWGKKDIRTSKCQMGDGTYVAELLTKMPFGTCSLIGDPHVLTFDDPSGQEGTPAITQTTPGDFYLVKGEDFTIQGRFGYSSRFPTAASLVGMAVGGSLIGNNKLVVEYTGPAQGREGFKAWWNDEEILTEGYPVHFTSKDNFLVANLSNMDPTTFSSEARSTIGGTAGNLPSYLFRIAPDIQIYMLLGNETMNGVITMRKLHRPMDGYCGNFNCVANDDGLAALETRGLSAPISQHSSLFKNAPKLTTAQKATEVHAMTGWLLGATVPDDAPGGAVTTDTTAGATPNQNDCDGTILANAEKQCQNLTAGYKDSCIFDVCASGGSVRMGNEDIAAAAISINAQGAGPAAMVASISAVLKIDKLVFPLFGGEKAPAWLQATCCIFVVGLMLTGVSVGMSRRTRYMIVNTAKTLSRRLLSRDPESGQETSARCDEDGFMSDRVAAENEPLLA
mmetsp:Transcript_68014/g.221395  ORF Transcript_68014/g.221395 Transcript_68014/m.221395 type:complete len:568 (-) Transcript_68014:30-1733(-)